MRRPDGWEKTLQEAVDHMRVGCGIPLSNLCFEAGADAMLKAIYEWGNEECTEKSHWQLNAKKRECVVCWQELLKDIG